MPFRSLAADDIFISYTRLDASTYAAGLADELTKKGFSCFIDKLGTVPDKDLPDMLRRKIKSCAMLVIVGTERAASRQTIADEVGEFLRTGRRSMIVPVDFGGAVYKASWYPLVEGVAPEPEKNPDALDDGNPSPSVLSRIEKQFKYARRNQRLRRAAFATAALLALLLLAGVGAGVYARQQLIAAVAASAEAEQERRKAGEARAAAEDARRAADAERKAAGEAKADADRARDEAGRQKKLADDATLIAKEKTRLAAEKTRLAAEAARRAQAAAEQARLAQAEAERQQTIAEARGLANRSQALLRRRPEALHAGVSLAVGAARKASAVGAESVEADTALREGLALLPRLARSRKIEGDFTQAALSPDASHFATLTTDKLLRVYTVADRRPILKRPCEGHAVALDNNAAHAACASGNSIKVFGRDGGSREITVEGEGVSVWNLALGPDGKYLAVIYSEGDDEDGINRAALVEVKTGARLVLAGVDQGMRISDVAFHANGNLALGGSVLGRQARWHGRVLLWTFSQREFGGAADKPLTQEDVSIHGEQPADLDAEVGIVAPGPDAWAFATDRGVWKLSAGRDYEPVARLPSGGSADEAGHQIDDLALTTGGLVILRQTRPADAPPHVVGADRLVEWWDASGHRERARQYHGSEMSRLAFVPGRDAVAVLEAEWAEGNPHAYRLGTGELLEPEGGAAEGDFLQVALQEDGFYVTDAGREARVTDAGGRLVGAVPYGQALADLNAAALSAGGAHLALAGPPAEGAGTLVLFYARRGDAYHEERRLRLDALLGEMLLTPDGRLLATLEDFVARVRETTTWKEVTPRPLAEAGHVSQLKFSTGGRFLAAVINAAGGSPPTVTAWRLADGREAATLPQTGEVSAVVFSPGERFLLTAAGRALQLADLSGPSRLRLESESPVTAAAFSHDERIMAVGSEDGLVRVLRRDDPEAEVARLTHTGEVTAVAFSADGRYLATASKRHNPYGIAPEENFPLRVWLLRPQELIAEGESRLASIPAYAAPPR